MKNSSDVDKSNYGKTIAFLFIWIVTTAVSPVAGHLAGYVAGMRPGGWNIHLIYPPIFGGFIGVISYPTIQFSLRIGSDDIDKGLFLGIPIAVALAFGITILILKSGRGDGIAPGTTLHHWTCGFDSVPPSMRAGFADFFEPLSRLWYCIRRLLSEDGDRLRSFSVVRFDPDSTHLRNLLFLRPKVVEALVRYLIATQARVSFSAEGYDVALVGVRP